MKTLISYLIVGLFIIQTSLFAAGTHHHKKYHVQNVDQAPTLELEVLKDAKMGWNVHLITTNFRFTPENVNQKNIEGEGHAHLYVNKKKIRIYGPYFHIMKLQKGKNSIRATLNANDHSEYAVGGNVIESSVTINQ